MVYFTNRFRVVLLEEDGLSRSSLHLLDLAIPKDKENACSFLLFTDNKIPIEQTWTEFILCFCSNGRWGRGTYPLLYNKRFFFLESNFLKTEKKSLFQFSQNYILYLVKEYLIKWQIKKTWGFEFCFFFFKVSSSFEVKRMIRNYSVKWLVDYFCFHGYRSGRLM